MAKNYKNPLSYDYFKKITENLCEFPFSFNYNDEVYNGFLGENIIFEKSEKNDNTETFFSKIKIDESLTAELKAVFYESHGAIDWTVWFENISDKNSGILKNLESRMEFVGDNPVLKGILGDHENFYKPYEYDLSKENVHFQSDSGRATHVNFPYFNLEYGEKGVMLAIGWAGTWTADFIKNDYGVTYTAKSVNNLASYLKPGEKIRTALFCVAPYTIRDEFYATNYWRSFFIECNMPKADNKGNSITPFSTCSLAHDTGFKHSDGSISERYSTWKPSLEKMMEENVKVDFRWFDAGWYISPDMGSAEPGVKGHDWWDTVGTWELDPIKWPGKTFRESTDFAREHGMKTLMWFEPERITMPDHLTKNFGYTREWAIEQEGTKVISNNIGKDECRKWTTERICKILRDNKVEMYREDNNCDAAMLWNFLDSKEGENRCGITECKFIDAHYKMWDDIIECTLSYGGCGFVDSCASGGGRNDLESMRRGVPLLRSDFDRTTIAIRLSMTTSFNKWIPFCGAITKEKPYQTASKGISDKYVWRASYLPVLNVSSQFVQDPDQDFDILRFGINEWKKINSLLMKDFYVLTPWKSKDTNDSLIAYSFFDSEKNNGIILAFRQEECKEEKLSISLPYAEDNERITLTDEDTDEKYVIKDNRIELLFDKPRTARLLWVNKEEI